MYVTPEKFLSASKASVETALAFAEAHFAAVEKVAAVNVASAKASFHDAAEHVRSVLAAKDAQELVQINSAAAQPSIEKAVDYARSVYDATAQAQANLVKALDAQTTELNKAFGTTLEAFAKNSPVGSEAMVGAMKSTLAMFNAAYDNASKFAKQTNSAIDHQFTTATQATRAAAKRRS